MTISDSYLKMQKELHKDPNYGTAGTHFANLVLELMQTINAQSVSDYGAGKCSLQKELTNLGFNDHKYFPYDPAFPEYGDPKTADVVCCIDVLEHIEPLHIDAVLSELSSITKRFGVFTVNCMPAKKILSDGRNAHLIQKPLSWWLPKFEEKFKIKQVQKLDWGFWLIVSPKLLI